MTAPITLDPAHRALVLAILRAHLPDGARVSVFGSRANGRARLCSDLDLAIDADRPLTLDEAAILAEAFTESDLPFMVDLIDIHAIEVSFRARIAATSLPLTEPGAASQTMPCP